MGKRTLALLGLLGVLGFAAAASAVDSVNVTMAPQSGSSESGTAMLTKEGADTTKVVVNLRGATGQQPALIWAPVANSIRSRLIRSRPSPMASRKPS